MDDKLIEQLAWARYRLEGQGAEEQGLEDEIKMTEAGIRLDACREEQAETRKVIADLESQIRTEALAVYAADGNKRPHTAVSIKEFTVLDYDPKLALEYCVTHWPAALKLNATAFEKISKIARPEFVTEHVEPRAQIATDLSRYVDAIDDAE
jgi:hypothetical protein